jgi:hypothetical protein
MRTKYAVTALLLSLTAPAFADDMKFIPLQDFINQSGAAKDPASIGYVMSRCSALYSVFAKNLEGETDPERQKRKAEWYNAGERFMGAAAGLMMNGTTIEIKDALARTGGIVVGIGNLYVDRIEQARLLTGNMFTDTLIAGDFTTCKGLLGIL